MNWQLIDNVPPPKNRLLVVVVENDNHRCYARFAMLKDDGRMYFSDRPSDLFDDSYCESEDFEYLRTNAHEYPMYLSFFIWP